jgi:Tfp pilus assembly protein PilV
MQKCSRRKKIAGFTIIEVAMAAGVMALAIGSSLIVLARGFNQLDTARCLSYASQIMQSELEKMRLTQWSTVNAYAKDTEVAVTIPTTFFTAQNIASRMTMTRNAHLEHTGMIKVTLTLTWTTNDRRTLVRKYITYYGENGLYDYFAA